MVSWGIKQNCCFCYCFFFKAETPCIGRTLQKRAFRDHSEHSMLTEVLSWRRTLTRGALLPTWLLPLLFILQVVSASESPERECCENPSYNFQEPGRGFLTTPPVPSHTYSPPEEPDMLPEVPELPGWDSRLRLTNGAGL
jgi:hypothetical protein